MTIALVAALGIAGCGGDNDESGANAAGGGNRPGKVVIAYITKLPGQDAIVKHERWLEDSLGTKIEWKSFDAGPDVARAVGSGQADLGYLGSTPAAAGITNGLTYKVVYIYSLIAQAEALAVQSDANIRTVPDLQGKTVATTFGSTAHYTLVSALENDGVDPDAVKMIDLPPQDMVAAWKRGDIDAAYVWEPFLGEMLQGGGEVLIDSADLAKAGNPALNVGIVNANFAEEHADVVTEWVRQLDRATTMITNDRPQAVTVNMDELDISKKLAAAGLKGLTYLSAKEQTQPQYFGTTEQPGELANAMYLTGKFLVSAGVSSSPADKSVFEEAVKPEFVDEVGAGG